MYNTCILMYMYVYACLCTYMYVLCGLATQVRLHVYDVSHEEGIQIVNDVFANTLASTIITNNSIRTTHN